jgi:cell division protein ZapE
MKSLSSSSNGLSGLPHPNLLQQVDDRIHSGDLEPDPAQRRALIALQKFYDDLITPYQPMGWLSRLGLAPKPVPMAGVYLYGPVGRGKTFVMDLFFDALHDTIKKRRTHFHAFMISVHDYMHGLRQAGGHTGVDDVLPKFAAHIASTCDVLCFDEFHVIDVADAMILQRLFTALFAAGVRVVMTSNWPPERLYEKGLQRDLFLPFIKLIHDRLKVVAVDGSRDYRVARLQGKPVYFYPLNTATDSATQALFHDLTDQDHGDPETLMVKGRQLMVPQSAHGVARMGFSDLCEKPLGAEDYLALAANYHTLILEHIPKLTYDRRNEVKRLMILVDIWYEKHLRLIISAAAAPEHLYIGADHAFEFQRTLSRLQEMQSIAYLKACGTGI